MPGIATLAFDLHLAALQVDIVMDDDKALSRVYMALYQRRHRLTTGVHIGLGFYQHHLMTVNRPGATQSSRLALFDGNVMPPGKQVYDIKANIVTVMLVTLTRIA